ncbi:hypothetical protein AXW38_09870 [Yersinia ruckeri]|uniref:hypothetical protein n=1 Tax=Yersinia ruckeri TaxID=29486 RepID=UPI0004E2ED6C|nr:hypothetical protein [Yersinia ruckeri]ARZ01308.1 hypothetical protein QMA0440_01975 [Yersinia ruckeri]EKN4700353.1 hypothetical protein [Yersinia ruckeri]KFE37347.1 hypothetical protein nADLYRO1b_3306 [Yersinia ruckeri]MCW6583602.1 hypothetical protein [Yersinia ruckeri]MCW6595539.1 hypothetical protein [Yersinia ruckeri]
MADVFDWPMAIAPSDMRIQLLSNSKIFQSPFSGASQTVSAPGSRWVMTLNFKNLQDDKARVLEALVADLDGVAGRVRLWDFARGGRSPAGTPVVSQAEQRGKMLATRGWLPNRLVLLKGDYITVNDELKKITQEVRSDLSGQAVICFSPQLRWPPAAGAPIECRKPTGLFRLIDEKQGDFSRIPGIFHSVSLQFTEAF